MLRLFIPRSSLARLGRCRRPSSTLRTGAFPLIPLVRFRPNHLLISAHAGLQSTRNFDAETAAVVQRNLSPRSLVKSTNTSRLREEGKIDMKLLLFCILLVVCWPAALLVLVLYPIIWLILLPLRIVGIAVSGVLELIAALFSLPGRVVRAI